MQEIVRQTPALRPAIESIIAGQVETSLRQVDDVSHSRSRVRPGHGFRKSPLWNP